MSNQLILNFVPLKLISTFNFELKIKRLPFSRQSFIIYAGRAQ